jgi:hypothetical protein
MLDNLFYIPMQSGTVSASLMGDVAQGRAGLGGNDRIVYLILGYSISKPNLLQSYSYPSYS